MHVHDSKLASMTAIWLLPIAPPVVASAAGGLIAEAFIPFSHNYALWTLITSYVLWGTAIPLSMTCLVLYFHRLTMHNLPPREVIVSAFLPVAPLGEGAFAILQFGKVAAQLFPETRTLDNFSSTMGSGYILYILGWLVCLVMWAYGLAWLFFALSSIVTYRKFPFNIGWWGFTFPLGVWSSATLALGEEMPSVFFSYLGTVSNYSGHSVAKFRLLCYLRSVEANPFYSQATSCVVALLWVFIGIMTIHRIITGEIFVAPDLKSWQDNRSATDERSIKA